MATPLSSFLPEILLSAPGLADVIAESYVRNSAIKFCNLTRYVIETLDSQTIRSGEYEVDLIVSGGEEVAAVKSVYVDGRPIDPISEQDLSSQYGGWKTYTGWPKHYLSDAAILRLFPIPTAEIVVDVTVAKRPTSTAVTVNDVLYKEWREAIVAGALSQILLVPNQTFTNPQIALVQNQIFSDWVVTAQAKSYKQTNRAALRVEAW